MVLVLADVRCNRNRLMEQKFLRTTDHDSIRNWINEHNGTPSSIVGTKNHDTVDIAFGTNMPGYKTIPWDYFFERLDTQNLIFRYSNTVVKGQETSSYSFISEENPSDSEEDETEFVEANELAEENINNSEAGDKTDEEIEEGQQDK